MDSKYPEKTCTIDKLVTHSKLVKAALQGKKIQQRRNGIYGYPGETFKLENQTFEIIGLKKETLGDMTDQDAQNEGYPSLEMYKNLIIKMHQGANISFDDSSSVWVHTFKII